MMVVKKRHGRGIADIVKEKYGDEVVNEAMVATICTRIVSSYFSIHDYMLAKNSETTCSMLNHSCEPNCVWVSDGRTMVVRTVKDVAAGEQFFIGYINPYIIEKHNKTFMSKYFGFVPSCKHCDLPNRALKSDQTHLAKVNALYNAQDWQAVVDYSGSIKSTLTIVRVTEIQFNAYHKLNNYPEAVKCAQKALDLTRCLMFVKGHLLNELHMGHPCDHHFDGIAVFIEEAVKAAEMSHGPDHSLTKECDDLLSHTEQFVQEAIPLVQRAILRKHLKSSSITFLKI
eukprot:Em0002g485a